MAPQNGHCQPTYRANGQRVSCRSSQAAYLPARYDADDTPRLADKYLEPGLVTNAILRLKSGVVLREIDNSLYQGDDAHNERPNKK